MSDPDEAPGHTEGPTTAPSPAAAVPPSSSGASPGTSPAMGSAGRPLNRAEVFLLKVNVKPWRATLPAVVQSVNKDMQCSIVRSREPGRMVCAHLRAGRGFTISAADYELW